VILLLHDVADPFMEIGKMLLYTGNNTGADVSFGVFALGINVSKIQYLS
jgi:hypothetical protein